VLTTDRLDLIPFTVGSARAVADDVRDGQPWAADFPREDDRDAAKGYLSGPHEIFGSWFIAPRADGLVVGTIGFFGPPSTDGELMVGYGLVPAARGHGYATEALRALAGYGLAQPGVRRILAETDLDNTASHGVLAKSGFVRTHTTETSAWYELRPLT